MVGGEPLERSLEGDADVLRRAVEPALPAPAVRDVPELRREDDLVAAAGDRAADELLVRVRAVDLRRVDEGDAELDRAVDRADRLRVVAARTCVERGHAHAAEPELRDVELAK